MNQISKERFQKEVDVLVHSLQRSKKPLWLLIATLSLAIISVVFFSASADNKLAVFADDLKPSLRRSLDIKDNNNEIRMVEQSENSASLTTRTTIKENQIQNYKDGKALIRSIHITHHAGTSLCATMRKYGDTPNFACNGGDNWPVDIPTKGWSFDDTATYVDKLRQIFHYTSSEYGSWGNLHLTNFEYENLISLVIMRHPLDRFLAGGKCGSFHKSIHGDPTEDNMDLYWEYANSGCADNYALRVFTKDNGCVDGEDTPSKCLDEAKELLQRLTIIIDQECFDDSVHELEKTLGLSVDEQVVHVGGRKEHASAKERIGNDELYDFLTRRFQKDIEL